MCRVDDCSSHGYVIHYWICRSYVSIISLGLVHFRPFFLNQGFWPLIVYFDLSLSVGGIKVGGIKVFPVK